ncbi:MAG: hypothetical protein Q7Q73_02265 [Verrucomicrobiota bacterium JB024]|nr:hypothetical protein [Verrucomicrobiota bacterium JB024]
MNAEYGVAKREPSFFERTAVACRERAGTVGHVAKRYGKRALIAGGAAVGLSSSAMAQVTLPEPLGEGVSLADYVTVAITGLGTIMIAVVGGYFAFKLIQLGMRKAGKIGG